MQQPFSRKDVRQRVCLFPQNRCFEVSAVQNEADGLTGQLGRRVQHRTGFILAGEGDQEVEFEVDRVILERSPVIRDWIERLSTPSETMLKDGALNLTKFDPQVVKYVIDVLGASRYDDGSQPFQYPTVRPYVESAVFYAKVYKLSKNLGCVPNS